MLAVGQELDDATIRTRRPPRGSTRRRAACRRRASCRSRDRRRRTSDPCCRPTRAPRPPACRRRTHRASTSGSRARPSCPCRRAWRGRLAGIGSSTGGAKLPSAHTVLPVFRFRIASSARFCASPTAVRAGNVLGVAGLVDVVRDDRRCARRRAARRPGRTRACRRARASGRSPTGDPASSSAGSLSLLVLLVGLLLLVLLPRSTRVEQLLFFVAMNFWLSVSARIAPSSGATSVSCCDRRRRRAGRGTDCRRGRR